MSRCIFRKIGNNHLQKPTLSIFRAEVTPLAARPREKLVHHQATWRNIPKDSYLDPHRRENLKSQTLNQNFTLDNKNVTEQVESNL